MRDRDDLAAAIAYARVRMITPQGEWDLTIEAKNIIVDALKQSHGPSNGIPADWQARLYRDFDSPMTHKDVVRFVDSLIRTNSERSYLVLDEHGAIKDPRSGRR